ncbi:synaptonemal complex protein 1-like [Teleopsis dalmanni]|uniref:synaptonemal complex protein 1-like n=1 Tax=Teleopsis dalmanni TaxID=139649 RepID=UPI0018CFAE5D|nr:synaptonemal complex protein 1-like [Teleopsis dalmanni]
MPFVGNHIYKIPPIQPDNTSCSSYSSDTSSSCDSYNSYGSHISYASHSTHDTNRELSMHSAHKNHDSKDQPSELSIYSAQSGYRIEGGYGAKSNRSGQRRNSVRSHQNPAQSHGSHVKVQSHRQGDHLTHKLTRSTHSARSSHSTYETEMSSDSSSDILSSKTHGHSTNYSDSTRKLSYASTDKAYVLSTVLKEHLNMENIDLSESTASHSSELSHTEFETPITFDPDTFFSNIEKIPSVNEVSLTSSHEYKVKVEATPDDNIGRFVDPLTGEVLTSTSSSPSVEGTAVISLHEKLSDEWGEIVEEKDIAELHIDLPEVPYDQTIDKEILDTKTQTDEEVFTQLYTEIFKPIQLLEKDTKLKEEQERKEMLQEAINQFVTDLVNKVVEKCERHANDPKRILRNTLDKVALADELMNKLVDLEKANKCHIFLNRKAVDYFRRKKAFSSLEEEGRGKKDHTGDEKKYGQIIKHLNNLLCRQKEMTIVTNEKIDELNQKKTDLQSQLDDVATGFETMIWDFFGRKISDNARNFVEKKLSRIRDLRADISEARSALIEKQHSMARLSKRLEELENLGNGLYMRDFENMQRETISLNKKLEERTNEFEKYSRRCNNQIHASTHLREKVLLMRDHVTAQELELRELLEEKQLIREELRKLKIKRIKLYKDIRELSFQCGLLDKPALLLDYDDTLDRLNATKANIIQIKSKLSDLQLKIKTAEEKLSAQH